MKKITIFLVVQLFVLFVVAQKELHIHHINVENGEATMIGIYDTGIQKYTAKILIDGGMSNTDKMLLPYLRKMVGSGIESMHFDYVILTHYHNDHYNGLLALKRGKMTADSIIDPGGYPVDSIFPSGSNSLSRPPNLKRAKQWLKMLQVASHHTPEPYVKARSESFLNFGTDSKTAIGKSFILGQVGSNDVVITCVAGWGNTLSDNGIEPNPDPELENANNYTLAFVISCGEFRYFIGGDMGGHHSSAYIDQETIITRYFNSKYPISISSDGNTRVSGHVCGFKAQHHGSDHSNTSPFMEGMHPAIVVTSAGNKEGWHLPNPNYLKRLVDVRPLSELEMNPNGIFNRGVYFTNLYNFNGFPSKTKANNYFKNKPGISYEYGNNSGTAKGSFLIKVMEEVNNKSVFEVWRVDYKKSTPYKKLAFFFCHEQ